MKNLNITLNEEIKSLRSQIEKQDLIEKKYEESQERFRVIFEQSKFGNKIINSHQKIIQVNKTLEEMLGYDKDELEGSTILKYTHPEHRNQLRDLRQNLWKKMIPSFQIEARLIKKDGSSLWCHVTSILFKDDNSTFGYTIIEDIAERKEIEANIERHTAAINNELDNFIYTASHDLKAPIVNIEGLMTALIKSLNTKFSIDEHPKKIFSMIGVSIEKLKSTIAHLVEISKVENEKEDAVEIVFIDTLIDEIYEDMGPLIGESPITLNKYLEIGEIRFPREKLKSIFYNLLSNAIKYRFNERKSEITIKSQKQDNFILIEVEDNGVGLSENNQLKLFSMFKRFYTGVVGTGIGLYITKRIVENAGGKIEVESKLNEGSIFRIYLPEKTEKEDLQSENSELKEEISDLINYQVAYEKKVEEYIKIEQQHKQSQVRFRTIFEKSHVGKKILSKNLNIVNVNDAFVAMLGYSDKTDIINRKILDFAHPDYIKQWQELQSKLWKEEIFSYSLDTCLVKKDGTVLCCHVNSILFEDEDRKLGYTIINERKILEEKSNGFTKPANDDVYGNP
ncbi:hypothetical protein BH23BAC1_BH23BAC1_41860 [soil metagenome]